MRTNGRLRNVSPAGTGDGIAGHRCWPNGSSPSLPVHVCWISAVEEARMRAISIGAGIVSWAWIGQVRCSQWAAVDTHYYR